MAANVVAPKGFVMTDAYALLSTGTVGTNYFVTVTSAICNEMGVDCPPLDVVNQHLPPNAPPLTTPFLISATYSVFSQSDTTGLLPLETLPVSIFCDTKPLSLSDAVYTYLKAHRFAGHTTQDVL